MGCGGEGGAGEIRPLPRSAPGAGVGVGVRDSGGRLCSLVPILAGGEKLVGCKG